MSAPVDVLEVMPNLPLPEPRGYRCLNTGEVRFNDDSLDPPVHAYEEWSVCSALYDADQVREYARAAVAELIAERDSLRVIARDFGAVLRKERLRCECGEPDCRTTRLDAALAKFGGAA